MGRCGVDASSFMWGHLRSLGQVMTHQKCTGRCFLASQLSFLKWVVFGAVLAAVLASASSRPAIAQSRAALGHFQSLAIEGMPAPYDAGVAPFGSLSFSDVDLSPNAEGGVIFSAQVTGVGALDDRVMWTTSPTDGSLRQIVREGGDAPSIAADTVFDSHSLANFNNTGQVALATTVRGPSLAAGHAAIYVDTPGTGLRLIVDSGATAPGIAPGTVFRLPATGEPTPFGLTTLNNAGQVAFRGRLEGPSVDLNSNAIYVDTPGVGLQFIAREGGAAPGIAPDTMFDSFENNQVFNEAGQLLFRANLAGPNVASGDRALYVGTPGDGLRLVANDGATAPGIATDTVFGGFSGKTLNNAGQVALIAGLEGPNVSSSDRAIYIDTPGEGLRLIANSGATAPGLPSGTVFDTGTTQFGTLPQLNNAGQVAFSGKITGPGTNPLDNAIYVDTPGEGLRLIASSGSEAPGAAPDTVFGELSSSPVIDDSGRVVFSANIAGPNVAPGESALYVDTPGDGLQLLSIVGELELELFQSMEEVTLFSSRDTYPQSTGVPTYMGIFPVQGTSQYGFGIWMEDELGGLQLMVQSGDVLEVAPGVFRTVGFDSSLFLSGIEDVENAFSNAGISESGELTMLLPFGDFNGVGQAPEWGLVQIAVPEPSTLVLALSAAGLLLFAGHRKRRR